MRNPLPRLYKGLQRPFTRILITLLLFLVPLLLVILLLVPLLLVILLLITRFLILFHFFLTRIITLPARA